MSTRRRNKPPIKPPSEKPKRPNATRKGKNSSDRLAIEFELARQIEQYVGKWVAIADDKIVAVGDDISEVMEASKRLGYEQPLVVRGPLTDEEVAYIL